MYPSSKPPGLEATYVQSPKGPPHPVIRTLHCYAYHSLSHSRPGRHCRYQEQLPSVFGERRHLPEPNDLNLGRTCQGPDHLTTHEAVAFTGWTLPITDLHLYRYSAGAFNDDELGCRLQQDIPSSNSIVATSKEKAIRGEGVKLIGLERAATREAYD